MRTTSLDQLLATPFRGSILCASACVSGREGWSMHHDGYGCGMTISVCMETWMASKPGQRPPSGCSARAPPPAQTSGEGKHKHVYGETRSLQ